MASESLTTATAFWSYAHSDDDGSDGQIRRLKDGVDHAFKRHSGETLKSFFDRYGTHRLEWGEEWRSKIGTTISGTTFFVPVISPSYLKSASCQDEFNQFWEKARDSDLQELLLPILWVPVYPETEEEKRIWDVAGQYQYIDWTRIRKLDEKSPEYKTLIDEMGERLADAARKVAVKPEVIEAPDSRAPAHEGGPDEVPGRDEPPGLLDLHAESTEQSAAMAAHMQEAFAALNRMQKEVSIQPLHPGASAGQKLFYFKRVAKEISPYADEFERKAKQSEEAARLLNKTIFDTVDLLSDPRIRETTDYEENIDSLREVPAKVQSILGNIDGIRSQVSQFGRMSRDLRIPFSALERGFDSLDAILQLVEDWTVALQGLAD